jgi:hypothetical protein
MHPSKQILAVGAVVVLAVIAGILTLSTRSDDRAATHLPAPVVGTRAEQGLPREELQEPVAAEVQLEQPSDAERTKVDHPAGRNELEVLVRDLESGQPLPGAEVICLDGFASASAADALMREDGFDLEALRRTGSRVTTDDRGRALFSCRPGVVTFIASTATHFGVARARVGPATDRNIEVKVYPYRQLLVQVTDASGNKIGGIEVLLSVHFAGEFPRVKISNRIDVEALRANRAQPSFDSQALSDLTQDLRATTRGSDGIARLGPILDTGDVRCALGLAGVFPDQSRISKPSISVNLAALPTEPVQIVLPTHGSLEVRLVDPSGKPVSCPGTVRIGCRSTLAESWQASLTAELGLAKFEQVAIDFDFWVSVVVPGIEQPFAAVAIGPRVAGERATAAVGLPYPPTWFSLRARDVDQMPLSWHDMSYLLVVEEHGTRREFTGRLTTDSVGAVAFALDSAPLTSSSGLLKLVSGTPGNLLVALAPVEIQRGQNELGAIVLSPAETLAEGVVLDPNGEPCTHAIVSIRHDVGGQELPLDWLTSDACDFAGRFKLQGRSSEAHIRLRAECWMQGAVAELLVTPGAKDVVLQLVAAK